MKAASLGEIKKELQVLHPDRMVELCLALAKHKKENKEFLSYLLFDSDDPLLYCKEVKAEIADLFDGMNTSTVYLAKKTLRKILRTITKRVAFASSKRVEVELLVYFCQEMNASKLPVRTNATLLNMYQRQLDKIRKSLSQLHEDLQADYADVVANLALM